MRERHRAGLLWGLIWALLPGAGCVERRLIVRADVTGAKVFLDGEPRGETPCTIGFVHYGTREVVVRAEGRKVERRAVPLVPPWYQFTPVDFFAEVLWPGTIEDVHEIDLVLAPLGPAGESEARSLAARAEALRADRAGAVSGTAAPREGRKGEGK